MLGFFMSGTGGMAWLGSRWFHPLTLCPMDTLDSAPKPWENLIRVSDSILTEPALEAAIHADTRLSPEARGVLIAALSFNVGWPIDTLAVARENTTHGKALEELHTLGYLRVGDFMPCIGGARLCTSLYGRTLLGEAVASAQHFRFVTEQEAYDFVSVNGHLLGDAETQTCAIDALIDSFEGHKQHLSESKAVAIEA